MIIKSRPLNKGETFPCSFNSAKKLFKETDVFLNFSYTKRVYGTFANTPDSYYLRNKIKGKVIASMYMYPSQTEPFLSFFILKANEFDNLLKQQFENQLLPKFFEFYTELLQQENVNFDTSVFLVELVDGRLKTHRYKFK